MTTARNALLLVLLSLVWACAAEAQIVVPGPQLNPDGIDLVAGLTVWHDVNGAADLPAAQGAFHTGAFVALHGRSGSVGFSRDALWFHVAVENRDPEVIDAVLAIAQPRLDRVDLYLQHADGEVEHSVLGDTLPFAQRSLAHRDLNVRLRLRGAETAQLFLRVVSTTSIQLPLTLTTEAGLFRSTHNEQAGIGLYYGILLALLLYNLAVLISIRDASYLWYVLYVVSFGLLMLSFNGYGYQYLWPNSPWWQNAALPFSLGAILTSSIAFAYAFLSLRSNLPRVARWFRISLPIFAALGLLGLTGWRYEATVALNIAVIVMGLMVTGSAVMCALRGYRPAVYFLLAWTLLIAGGVVVPLSSFGVLPRSLLTENGLSFGSAAEMLLLSFSLAYRINLLRAEKERAVREANESLELRVAERTQELRRTASHLETANQLLREASQRDGLTGLFNRRHLDQVLTEAWNDCAQRGQALSLIMLDIDHFKSVNDRYGHVAGDDCLREVARRVRSVFENTSVVVARYGGEEFMLVLAGVAQVEAHAHAESLRRAVADQMVATEGGQLPITVSLGVTTLDPRRGALADLIRVTDQALYEAKRQGRNRVVVV